MAIPSDHLALSVRLDSRHRRRRSPLPRRARRGRWGAPIAEAAADARFSAIRRALAAAHGEASCSHLARGGAQREGGKGWGFSAEQGLFATRVLTSQSASAPTAYRPHPACGSSRPRLWLAAVELPGRR
jgi:hypothetical protein